MADVDIAIQRPTAAGVAPTFTALDATDTYFVQRRNGDVMLYFKNTGGSAATITFDVTQSPGGLSVVDPTVSVPATTGERVLAAFPALYEIATGDDSGKLKFTCDQATGVSVAVLQA